jgi:hypothetical protein
MNPGMVGAGTSRLNPDGGSVDAHLKTAPSNPATVHLRLKLEFREAYQIW